jgi:hypothetical protein
MGPRIKMLVLDNESRWARRQGYVRTANSSVALARIRMRYSSKSRPAILPPASSVFRIVAASTRAGPDGTCLHRKHQSLLHRLSQGKYQSSSPKDKSQYKISNYFSSATLKGDTMAANKLAVQANITPKCIMNPTKEMFQTHTARAVYTNRIKSFRRARNHFQAPQDKGKL